MSDKTALFHTTELEEFRQWIQLDMDSITWQGRYTKEFEDLWKCFFFDGIDLSQLMNRLQFARLNVKTGLLSTWFSWLQEKFICFTFIKKNMDIHSISQETNTSISNVASILRNFFLSNFPHLDDYLSHTFQVGNMASDNLHLSFGDIKKTLNMKENIKGHSTEDIMNSIEVTLYEEWSLLLPKMKQHFSSSKLDLQKLKKKTLVKKQTRFLQEIFLLSILGGLLIYGIYTGNKWYEKYLTGKISIYRPQLKWPDKILKFKETQKSQIIAEDIRPNLNQIEKEQKIQQEKQELDQDPFEIESEVMITSWDQLPRDFDMAKREQSKYEEFRKGGYRDTRFGNKTVYRVMMRSVNPLTSKKELNFLLNRYKITQVDNVRPGLYVPGGIYYNLLVPHKYVKEFLAQVMDLDEAILYESRTRRANPPGKTKVFVWIKII